MQGVRGSFLHGDPHGGIDPFRSVGLPDESPFRRMVQISEGDSRRREPDGVVALIEALRSVFPREVDLKRIVLPGGGRRVGKMQLVVGDDYGEADSPLIPAAGELRPEVLRAGMRLLIPDRAGVRNGVPLRVCDIFAVSGKNRFAECFNCG